MLFFCTAILCCAFIAPKYTKAQTTADLSDPNKTISIGELTLTGYDSTSEKVFNGSKLADLYSALTGGRGATLQDVKDELATLTHSQYGTAVKTTLPNYKTASEIYTDNNEKNIVLSFGGQEWTVTFLTTDSEGNIIATLWMTQPLEDNGAVGAAYTTKDGKVTTKYGWATSNYSSTISTDTSVIISNNYSVSRLRIAALNGGNTIGDTTYYTSATATASVTLEQRLNHPLAKFTLENSVLTGENANKSLINYITQPFDVEYTYVLDAGYAFGNSNSYLLNEALTRDASGNIVTGKLSTTVANSSVNLNGTGASNGAWFQQGVYNYAYSANNYYNDWGSDYVWVPSVSEIGRTNSGSSFEGLWGTGASTTGQVKFNTGSTTQASSCLSGSTNTTEYIWMRSGNVAYSASSQVQSSSGGTVSCYTAGTNAIRPALHLNLTKADEAGKTLEKPTQNTLTYTYDGSEQIYLPTNYNSATMDITGNAQTNADSYTVTVKPKAGLTWSDGTTDAVEFSFRINKATPSVTPVFSGGRPYNTAGFPDPDSYTAGANGIEITGKFTWPNQSQLIEVDKSKEYAWLFTPDEEYIENFNTVTGTATFNFQERKIEGMVATFDSGGATVYTKTSLSDLMKMITLTVTYNDGETVNETNFEINCSLHEGTGNTITVSFGNQLPQTVTVTDYVVLAEVEGLVIVYNQGSNKLTPFTPLNDLKQYLTVYPQWNYTSSSAPLKAEEYELEGTLTVGSPQIKVVYEGVKEVINPAPNVSKAVYDTSAIKFEDKLAAYTGEVYETTGWVTGLPAGVTVEYSCDSDLTEVGTHTVTAHFVGDYENYEAIPDRTAVLTIENNYALPEFVNAVMPYDPAGNTFELNNYDSIKDIAELTLNGEKITEIDEALTQTEIGEYTLTITLTDGKFLGDKQSVTLTFSIVKCVVDLPKFILGSLTYNGKTITPTAENFEFNTSAVMFVGAESGLNAGSYLATFVLADTEHYEWENTNTKSVARIALAEDELSDGEIQVSWTIAKATVSAVAEEGKMPAFTCATVGDLSKYITYTYYKDELCTEAVAFADLQPDTRYYVKAVFTDEDGNFELDDSAQSVLNGASAYDTAPKEPGFIQKAFAYVKEHWLWFAIGAGVLLFLILLIIIIAATSKKRKQRAEERKAEKKEEERQRRAEEREERMMRMQMGSQMPITAASMYAAQQAQQQQPVQPQSAQPLQQQQPIQPQPVQQQPQLPAQQTIPYQPSGAYLEERLRAAEERARYAEERMARTEEERARQAEERTLRAAEERARYAEERSRIAEEQLLRNSYTPRVTPSNGGENGNISLDALGALVLAALKNFAVKENTEQPAPAEQPQMIEAGTSQSANIPAVYPPDAVITTTTTVDTTQKPPRRIKRDEKAENSDFSDLDGFYENYNE